MKPFVSNPGTRHDKKINVSCLRGGLIFSHSLIYRSVGENNQITEQVTQSWGKYIAWFFYNIAW